MDESLGEWEVGNEISCVPAKLFILFQAGALFCFVSSLLREQPRRSIESRNDLIKVSKQPGGECGLLVLDC